jgi:hypothetical protein
MGNKAKRNSGKSKPKKAKEKTVDAPTADLWREIQYARRDERKAEVVVVDATEVLKAAKKRLDGASEHLGRLLDDAMNGQAQLPFGKTQPKPVEVDSADAWRSVALADLEPKIKPAKLKVLEEHDPIIRTLGDLVDWQTGKSDWWAKDIKGLGEGGVEQILMATDAYWAAHPRTETKPDEVAEKAKEELRNKITQKFADLKLEFTKDDGARLSMYCLAASAIRKLHLSRSPTGRRSWTRRQRM